jgi:imidazolonepropionase-like amidohydrolase
MMVDNPPLVLRVRRLFDGKGAPPRHDMAVTVAGERIVGVESCGPDWRPPDQARVVDCGDRTLLPGLIDSHVHLTMGGGATARENVERLQREEPDTLVLRAIANAQAVLRGGVTTARDCGGRDLVMVAVRRALERGLFTGPRLLVAGMPVTPTAGHCFWMGLQADTTDEVRRTVRWLCEQEVDFIKVMATGGMMTPRSNPWMAQYSVDDLRLVVDEAHRLGRHVAAHVLSSPGLANVLTAGVDTVEHVYSITGARQDYDPSLADRMARQGLFGSVTAHDGLRSLLPDQPQGNLELLRLRLTVHRQLREAGVRLLLHSDATGPPTAFDSFGLGIEVLVRGMDYTVHEAIHACTGLAAEALGLAAETGSIVPGKRADLLLVDGDPVEDLTALRRVHKVFRNGELVVQDGQMVPSLKRN